MTLTVSRVLYIVACVVFILAALGVGPGALLAVGLALVAAGLAVG